MAITKTVIQNSPSRTVFKIVGTAASDTTTIVLKSAITTGATGNVTFAASGATYTITRTTGSWVTDGYVVGSSITLTGTTSNNGKYSAIGVTALVLTVDRPVVNEVAAAAVFTSSNSDLSYPGQTFDTPSANITKVKYSVSSSGNVTVVRNAVTILNLFGHDSLNEFGLAEQNTSNIVVTFSTSAGGTLFLELAKISGWNQESQSFVTGKT